MAEMGVGRLILTGGEPLLHPELEKILQIAVTSGLYTTLITNGLLLNANRLDKLIAAGLRGITLSLDTLNPDIYYEHRGVRLPKAKQILWLISDYAQQYELSASINCVVSSLNSSELEYLIKTCNDLGLPVMIQPCNTDSQPQLQYLIPTASELPEVERNIQKVIEMKQDGFKILSSEVFLTNIIEYWSKGCIPPVTQCEYGFVNLTINHNGDILPCWRLPAVGNIHDTPVADLWNNSAMEKWRSRMLDGQCPGCWLACSFDWQNSIQSEKYAVNQWRLRLKTQFLSPAPRRP